MQKATRTRQEKAKQKDADLDATEALDRDLSELMQSGALRLLMSRRREEASGSFQKVGDPVESAFDKDRRELVQQAKSKARLIDIVP